MSRTTFFTVEVEGPKPSIIDASKNNELWALHERASTIKSGHRAGAWKLESLQRMAKRAGVTLRSASTISRDSKGFIKSSERVLMGAA